MQKYLSLLFFALLLISFLRHETKPTSQSVIPVVPDTALQQDTRLSDLNPNRA